MGADAFLTNLPGACPPVGFGRKPDGTGRTGGSSETLRTLRSYCTGGAGGAAIHIDTGMNRLGLSLAEAQGIIPRINAGDHGMPILDPQALTLLKLREAAFTDLFRATEDELGKAEVFFTILNG